MLFESKLEEIFDHFRIITEKRLDLLEKSHYENIVPKFEEHEKQGDERFKYIEERCQKLEEKFEKIKEDSLFIKEVTLVILNHLDKVLKLNSEIIQKIKEEIK